MRIFTLVGMAVAAASFGLGGGMPAHAAAPSKVSGPYVHENLAVYFIHGESSTGVVPLTLAEALAKGTTVKVRELGSVNTLEIENTGDVDVFIQAGDIVKGGQQDRVLTVSMILPAKSGKVPIGSFCVEQGRWAKRGAEDVKQFASAAEALPSREAKLAMKSPAKVVGDVASASPAGTDGASAERQQRMGLMRDDTSRRQSEVWASVAGVQRKLGDSVGAPVASAQSASSLQLSLENDKVQALRKAYVAALQDKGTGADVVGYVFAVNGRINSADQYPSTGLFQKMWPKLLAASATEALGEAVKTAATGQAEAPAVAVVEAFLLQAEAGASDVKPLGTLAQQELRNTDKALFVEARTNSGGWVHRNYLAK